MNRNMTRLYHIKECIDQIECSTLDAHDYKTETYILHKLQIIGEAVRLYQMI